MMVTWVRGSFKNVEGRLDFDPANPRQLAVETVINASTCWTGVDARDQHLRSPDFLSCERYPQIGFKSTGVSQTGPVDYRVTGDLTIRDVTAPVTLDVRYLGSWETPGGKTASTKARGRAPDSRHARGSTATISA